MSEYVVHRGNKLIHPDELPRNTGRCMATQGLRLGVRLRERHNLRHCGVQRSITIGNPCQNVRELIIFLHLAVRPKSEIGVSTVVIFVSEANKVTWRREPCQVVERNFPISKNSPSHVHSLYFNVWPRSELFVLGVDT